MKKILITLTVLTTLQLVSAQERLPREEALKVAFLVSADLKQLQNTPIPTDVDVKQPVAMRDGDYGGMVLPEAKLTREALAKAGEQVVPIGQLWLLKLTPVRDGAGIPGDKLRLVTLKHEGDEVTVSQCALGVRRNGPDALELLVFGKDKEPLLKAPLKKIEAQQEPPIDLSAERTGDEGRITLRILGKYEAGLMVTELEP